MKWFDIRFHSWSFVYTSHKLRRALNRPTRSHLKFKQNFRKDSRIWRAPLPHRRTQLSFFTLVSGAGYADLKFVFSLALAKIVCGLLLWYPNFVRHHRLGWLGIIIVSRHTLMEPRLIGTKLVLIVPYCDLNVTWTSHICFLDLSDGNEAPQQQCQHTPACKNQVRCQEVWDSFLSLSLSFSLCVGLSPFVYSLC